MPSSPYRGLLPPRLDRVGADICTQIPELGDDCFKTASFVPTALRELAWTELHEGFATTGIVAISNGKPNGADHRIACRIMNGALRSPSKPDWTMPAPSRQDASPAVMDGHTTMACLAREIPGGNAQFLRARRADFSTRPPKKPRGAR